MQTQTESQSQQGWNFRSLKHVRSAAKVNSVSYCGARRELGAIGERILSIERGHQDASSVGIPGVPGLHAEV